MAVKNELDKITEETRNRLTLYLRTNTQKDLSAELEKNGTKLSVQTISFFKKGHSFISKKNLIILDEFLTEKGY